MATAGALVASLAIPIGIGARVLARRGDERVLPRWKAWRVPWGGFEVLAAFVIVMALIPGTILQLSGLPPLDASVSAFPLQLGALVLAGRLLYPWWNSNKDRVSLSRQVAMAIAVWLLLTPLVLLVNAIVIQVFVALDWSPTEHPLTKLGAGTLTEQILFLIQASIAAPIIEEILFRGILLPWMIGSRERHPIGLQPPTIVPPRLKPWCIMLVAGVFAFASGTSGPPIFFGVLAAGLGVLWVTVRCGKQHLRAIYASAALFGIIHSGVWPSPIPLFVLGLGLGWIAVRTRGFLAPAIVHGLFNAVSAVFVLRGVAS